MEAVGAWILSHWVEWQFAIFATVLGIADKSLHTKIKKSKIEQDALKNGMRSLLRDRIIQQYNFWNDKGYCPIWVRESIQDMYDAYHSLGGNGPVTNLVNKLFELPTDKIEEE